MAKIKQQSKAVIITPQKKVRSQIKRMNSDCSMTATFTVRWGGCRRLGINAMYNS